MNYVKDGICTVCGAIGGFIATALGGWDSALITLLIFMCIDFATGLVVAAVFHKSKHTESGALQSMAGWKGLCKKLLTLLFVLIANRVDITIGTSYFRDATVIFFIVNELISIVENAGLMGIKLPTAITKAIDILTEKAENAGPKE